MRYRVSIRGCGRETRRIVSKVLERREMERRRKANVREENRVVNMKKGRVIDEIREPTLSRRRVISCSSVPRENKN